MTDAMALHLILQAVVVPVVATDWTGIATLIAAVAAAIVTTGNWWRAGRKEAKDEKVQADQNVVLAAIKHDTDGSLSAAREEIKEAKLTIAAKSAEFSSEIQRQIADLKSDALAAEAARVAAKAVIDAKEMQDAQYRENPTERRRPRPRSRPREHR